MTNRGMATFAETASIIRDKYYAGEIERECAFQIIHLLCCDLVTRETEDPKLRHLQACAFTYAYMEPDTEC